MMKREEDDVGLIQILIPKIGVTTSRLGFEPDTFIMRGK
jgi:hypothetical protein